MCLCPRRALRVCLGGAEARSPLGRRPPREPAARVGPGHALRWPRAFQEHESMCTAFPWDMFCIRFSNGTVTREGFAQVESFESVTPRGKTWEGGIRG